MDPETRLVPEIFDFLYQHSPEPGLVIDMASWIVISVNDAFLQVSGLTREQVTGSDPGHSTIALLLDSLQNILKGKNPENPDCVADLTIRHLNGNMISFRAEMRVLAVSGRNFLIIQGTASPALKNDNAMLDRFRRIVEQTKAEIYLVKPDGYIEYVNAAAAQSLGYLVEELIGENVSLFDPDFGSRFTQHFEEVKLNDGSPLETLHITRDGRKIVKEMRPVYLKAGGTEYLCGFGLDITEQKKTRILLAESEEKYRTLVENMQDGVFIAQDSKIMFANEPYARILGYSVDEITGRPISQFISEKDLALVMERHKRRLSGDSLPNQYDFHLLHRDQVTELLVSMSVSTIMYHGTPAALGTIRDVSEQRKSERALRESEERYRTIFENTGTAMVIIEKDTTIILANSRFEQLSGYSREEIEGKMSWTRFTAVEDLERMKSQHALRRERREAALNSYEFRFISRYGELHHIMLSIDLIPGTTRSVASLLDITERKRIEESLTQIHTRLNLMNSITRHDIRNKTSIINGYLTLIEESGTGSDIDTLVSPIRSAIAAITSQLEFSKIYQDIGSKRPEWIRVREILGSLEVPAPVILTWEIPDLELYADPMIVKVFENLLDNSLRHGERVHTIRVSARDGDDGMVLIWQDDGVGIPDEEKSDIFERGFGKNTGLGLYLISNILAITGLSISETGEYGKGARFEISCYLGSYRLHRD